jgi:hypothetical protein
MTPIYPFAAIVGQEQLKQALLICAVDPTVGGVLVRGDKGSAKSTAARGLAAVLPPIRRAAGCGYNCEPDHPLSLCPVCSGDARALHDGPGPFINLPLGATEDRVLGSLDFEKALQGGKQAFKPGLLAGWIYIVIVSVRELSSSILLYSPGTEVVSVVIWELWQNGQYVELSALGVMMIVALFTFVMIAQVIGRRFGVKEV